MDQKEKPFEVPTLTTYGTLNELTRAHNDKIKTHGNARAWGHYKDDNNYKDNDPFSISVAS
jgi:hypothetical protein